MDHSSEVGIKLEPSTCSQIGGGGTGSVSMSSSSSSSLSSSPQHNPTSTKPLNKSLAVNSLITTETTQVSKRAKYNNNNNNNNSSNSDVENNNSASNNNSTNFNSTTNGNSTTNNSRPIFEPNQSSFTALDTSSLKLPNNTYKDFGYPGYQSSHQYQYGLTQPADFNPNQYPANPYSQYQAHLLQPLQSVNGFSKLNGTLAPLSGNSSLFIY